MDALQSKLCSTLDVHRERERKMEKSCLIIVHYRELSQWGLIRIRNCSLKKRLMWEQWKCECIRRNWADINPHRSCLILREFLESCSQVGQTSCSEMLITFMDKYWKKKTSKMRQTFSICFPLFDSSNYSFVCLISIWKIENFFSLKIALLGQFFLLERPIIFTLFVGFCFPNWIFRENLETNGCFRQIHLTFAKVWVTRGILAFEQRL